MNIQTKSVRDSSSDVQSASLEFPIQHSRFAIRNSTFPIRHSPFDILIAGGLMLAVVFTALAFGTVEAWSVAIFELIVVILLLLWAVKAIVEKKIEVAIRSEGLPLAALVLLGVIQSIAITRGEGPIRSLSMDVEATRGATAVIFFLFVSFLITVNFFAPRERLRQLASFLVVFGLVLAVFALVQHFTWEGKLFWIRPTPSAGEGTAGPFINRNHFAGYMEMLIPMALALAFTRGIRSETRLVYGFAAIIMGIAEAASLSRGGMVSLAAGLLFLAAMSARMFGRSDVEQRSALKIRPAHLVMVMLGAVAAGAIWVGADSDILRRITNDPMTSGSLMDRRAVWVDTLRMFSAHPILGVGLGAYETVYPIYGRGDGSFVIQFAHNDYLQVLSDGGIVGAALALWFIIVVFRAFGRGVKSQEPLYSALALGGAGGIFAILVHSLFDFNLQLPSNALLFLVLTAIVSTTGEGRRETGDGRPQTADSRSAVARHRSAVGGRRSLFRSKNV